MKSVFLDSSVLFTASHSPSGGSAKLFTIKKIQLHASTLVLTEVERNIRKKLTDLELERFFLLVKQINIISSLPDKLLIKQAEKVIVQKDAVILAEAKIAKTDILVTLDIRHFFTKKVAKFLKPQKVLIPKKVIMDFS